MRDRQATTPCSPVGQRSSWNLTSIRAKAYWSGGVNHDSINYQKWRCILSKKIDLLFFSLHCDSFELRDRSNLEYSITWCVRMDLNHQQRPCEKSCGLPRDSNPLHRMPPVCIPVSALTHKLGVRKWVRSLYHLTFQYREDSQAPSLIWLSYINLVGYRGLKPRNTVTCKL